MTILEVLTQAISDYDGLRQSAASRGDAAETNRWLVRRENVRIAISWLDADADRIRVAAIEVTSVAFPSDQKHVCHVPDAIMRKLAHAIVGEDK